ncbi:MAG: SAM-dependent chlorinase/fluorinase [Nitrospirota bacterium]
MNDPLITLTTDFGYDDPFVGMMKGVILKINPLANIVDLTHGIRQYDIREAAYTIGMSYDFFPKKTIHIVVVDPGVGSGRRPVIVMTDHHYFIGPDNGVFSHIYSQSHETLSVFHITSEHYFLSSGGGTFHGRDIFAPVAAWISRGVNIPNFGEHITDYHKIPLPFPQVSDNALKGEVILIDKFGNSITNIKAADIEKLYGAGSISILKILLKGKEIPLKKFYSQAEDRGVYSLINSTGYLEFFIYRGNASSEYNISVGDKVELSAS